MTTTSTPDKITIAEIREAVRAEMADAGAPQRAYTAAQVDPVLVDAVMRRLTPPEAREWVRSGQVVFADQTPAHLAPWIPDSEVPGTAYGALLVAIQAIIADHTLRTYADARGKYPSEVI